VNSAKSSCLSASSSRPLISYISNSRDAFSFSNNVILDQDRCASVNSIPSSERAFALTGQSMSPKVSKSDIEDDSFYASPDYKATDLSPLDPNECCIACYWNGENESCWMNTTCYWIFTLMCCTWFYRLAFNKATQKTSYKLHKLVFTDKIKIPEWK
jgi:hypothetical protein